MSYISKLSLSEVTELISTALPEEVITKIIKRGEDEASESAPFIRVITNNFAIELTDYQCQILIGDKSKRNLLQQTFSAYMYQKFEEPYLSDYGKEHFGKKIEEQLELISDLTEQITKAKQKAKELEERSLKAREDIRKQAAIFSKTITEEVTSLLQKGSDNIDTADEYRESPLFEIIEEDGEKYLHFSGYYFGYGDNWKSIEYPSCYISLQDFLDSRVNLTLNMTEELFAGAVPAITKNFTREEVNQSLNHLLKDRTSLPFFEITADTPCGEYYAPTGKNHRYSVTLECTQLLKSTYYVVDNKNNLPVLFLGTKYPQSFPRQESAELFCDCLNKTYYRELNSQPQITNTFSR